MNKEQKTVTQSSNAIVQLEDAFQASGAHPTFHGVRSGSKRSVNGWWARRSKPKGKSK